MGLKIRVSEITSYLDQINTSLSTKNDGLNQIMQGMQSFIRAPELTGDAWSAAKSYAETAHIPLLRGQVRANDEITNDNLTFASRIAEKIENEEIDEDALNRIIERLEQQRRSILYRNSLMTNSPSFGTRNVNADDGSNSITIQIHQLREEIQSLHDLESSCSDLYTTADSLLDNVSQGLSALSSTNCFDGSNGMYSTSKLKLDWAKSINKEWKDNFVLPLDYAKLVQEIKDDKSLSPTEKAEKIARVYEDYLYSLAKPAFDEYDKIRAKFGANSPEAIEAEKKLAGILQGLDIDIKAVARNLGDNAIDVSGKNTLNYKQFIDMVNTAKPLDLKSRTFGDSDYSIWARGWSDYIKEHPDYLGNYLFGYYGQGSLLIDGETLKIGAGVAQILSDANKGDFKKLLSYLFGFSVSPLVGTGIWVLTGYGDNTEDGNMVQEGINDFKKYYKNK
ncbi:T7SS effector LXG polymorphic toxin [Enterococcus sp. AZ192]|uniref:T7SS effector LXG polymorphic toxin n=1 Tax=unclassified Enterococcus TaxID=2608891 RepID=UPI003D2CF5A9